MERENLKQQKLELKTLRNNYQEKLKKLEELLKIPEVIEYRKTINEKEIIENEIIYKRNSYLKKLQTACDHPAWYLINETVDSYEQRRYWECKCLSCEYVTEQRSKDFNNKLVIRNNSLWTNKPVDASYDKVYEEYHELKDEKYLSDESICQMINIQHKDICANQFTKKQ